MKMSEIKTGLTLYPDGGFTCIGENVPVTVEMDEDGYFVRCADGQHYLDGQEDFHGKGECVGFSRSPWPK